MQFQRFPGIGGYKALNSALRKCRHCMAVSVDIHTKICEIDDLRDRLDVYVISFWLQTYSSNTQSTL